jgi:hypothetical protein
VRRVDIVLSANAADRRLGEQHAPKGPSAASRGCRNRPGAAASTSARRTAASPGNEDGRLGQDALSWLSPPVPAIDPASVMTGVLPRGACGVRPTDHLRSGSRLADPQGERGGQPERMVISWLAPSNSLGQWGDPIGPNARKLPQIATYQVRVIGFRKGSLLQGNRLLPMRFQYCLPCRRLWVRVPSAALHEVCPPPSAARGGGGVRSSATARR